MGEAWELAALIVLAAALYSSVGHAGASGYLAAMAVVGLAPETMRPTALALNILVATIATARYARAGQFDWRTLWPFALASVPAAFLGGTLHLPTTFYRPLVGAILLLAAIGSCALPGALPRVRWMRHNSTCQSCQHSLSVPASACSRGSPAPGAASS